MNIIDIETFNGLPDKPTLDKPISNAFRFASNKPINFAGRFRAILEFGKHKCEATVHVLKYTSSSPNILSYRTAYGLEMIHLAQSIEREIESPIPKLI